MTIIGERIRQRRVDLNITQEDLADAIKADQKRIWSYETGRSQPSAMVIIDLASALDTTTDWLLGVTDNPERPLRNEADLSRFEREIIDILRSKSPEAEKTLLEFIKTVSL